MHSRRWLLCCLAGSIAAPALAACASAAPASPTAAPPATPTVVPPPPLPSPTPSPVMVAPATAVPTTTIATTIAAIATVATMAPTTPPAPATATTSARAAAEGGLPLFDTHAHYSEDAWATVPIDRALALMDAAGTRLALVSSTPDTGSIALHRAAPDRIIPVLRPYRTRADMSTWYEDRTMPAYLEERLTLGVHRGIGEFHLSGDGVGTPVVAQIVRLAVGRDLLLHAHSDERAVEGLFAIDRRARVLWAHAGFTGPAALAAMLERHGNLWIETAIRGDIGSGGRLDPTWRALFERYPDRFMIGTDSYIISRWLQMPIILGEVRAWLLTLPPPLAEAMAWRNAARLLGIDEARFHAATP